MSRQVMPSQRFPIILAFILAVLLMLLAGQTLDLATQQALPQEVADVITDADVTVYVGEMYFRQEGLEENVLEANVGDEILFVNDGRLPHTVTIPDLGVDELLEPGDSLLVSADRALKDALVDCRLHARHDARLTVRDA